MRRAILAALACAMLAGCRVTFWAVEWDTRPAHNAAGGYADACGELPGVLGDDC